MATKKEIKSRGGYREGAGRPKGTTKEPKERVLLPIDVAKWIKNPAAIASVRTLMHKTSYHPHEPILIK